MKRIVAANRKKGSFSTQIGVAFENQDGSLTLKFDYLPTDPGTTIWVCELPAPQQMDPGSIRETPALRKRLDEVGM